MNEHPEIQNFLIFEDDAALKPGWEEILEKSMAHVPADYDVLYLGGILPPNRAAFEQVLTPVSKYFSRVKPNTIFGQQMPNPYFHSCAYAYIISRNGAIKVLESITARKGYWTSADHMLCSPIDTMNLYFMTPMIAGCYQDDDPVYANSEFNNFSRVDSFDSDLWNNDERFSKEEIGAALSGASLDEFNTATILRAFFNGGNSSAKPAAPVKKDVPRIDAPVPSVICEYTKVLPARFVTFKQWPCNISKVYEREWLCALLGNITHIDVVELDAESDNVPGDCPIVILQRPHTVSVSRVLKGWSDAGAKFKILHLSDELPEGVRDPLLVYTLPGCVGVLRNYIRDDFPPEVESKIHVIPLGWRWAVKSDLHFDPLHLTPNLPFREFHWSFFGTDWNGRSALMKPLTDAKLLSAHKFFKDWNDAAALKREDYLGAMLNSVFVPCPSGMNSETFRFYEALQAGCIPLVVKDKENEAWFNWVSKYIPLMALKSWEDGVRIMVTLLSKPETMEIYRQQILRGWSTWKHVLQEQALHWLLERS